jgi:hypothetical protein
MAPFRGAGAYSQRGKKPGYRGSIAVRDMLSERMLPSSANTRALSLLALAAASVVLRCYMYPVPSGAVRHMQTGESQYHARLAARIVEQGPLSYWGWTDELSMHPAARRPADVQPPGAHLIAAAVLLVDSLFSRGGSSLAYLAPAAHGLFLVFM